MNGIAEPPLAVPPSVGPTTRLGTAGLGRVGRVALVVLPLGVFANVAWTLLATDGESFAALATLPWGWLAAGLGLAVLPWLTGTLRLLVWGRFLGLRLGLADAVRLTLAVDLGAAVSPTAIGGEGLRWALLVRDGVRPGEAATLTLLPKLEDAVFFAVALPVAVVCTEAWRLPAVAASTAVLGEHVTVVLVVALVVAMAAWAFRRHAAFVRPKVRLRRTWRDARRAAVRIAHSGKRWFAVNLLLTAVHWLARYSAVAAVALWLGEPFDPVLFWLLQWVVFTIMSCVPTPGGAGAAEAAFAAVYAPLLPAGTIGVATGVWRLLTFYLPLALAAPAFAVLERGALGRHR